MGEMPEVYMPVLVPTEKNDARDEDEQDYKARTSHRIQFHDDERRAKRGHLPGMRKDRPGFRDAADTQRAATSRAVPPQSRPSSIKGRRRGTHSSDHGTRPPSPSRRLRPAAWNEPVATDCAGNQGSSRGKVNKGHERLAGKLVGSNLDGVQEPPKVTSP